MKIIKKIDYDFWFDVARKCEYATFFHSPLWHQLALSTYPHYKDASIGVELNTGTRAVLPLLETGRSTRGIFRKLVSTFAGCYGGVIADGPITIDECNYIYQKAVTWDIEQIVILGNPFCDVQTDALQCEKEDYFTQVLTINQEFDNVLSGFSKGHRRNTKKGKQLGVTTRVANTLDDYKCYFDVYQDSIVRWGDKTSSRYPWSLFENGCRFSQENPDLIKLWFAELEGKVIAGAWVFYWNNHAVYWHGAALGDYFSYYPNNVLLADVIEDVCNRGFKYFDFNPSGGHDGVAKFKERFGAEKWPLMYYMLDGGLYKHIKVGKRYSTDLVKGISRAVAKL